MRLALVAAVLLTACSSPLPTVASGPAPNPMAVDGDAREWEGSLRPVPDETGLSMGLRNDADALYLVVVAGDAWQARRVAARGMTVWFDAEGGTRKAYGLSFPVGMGSDGERGGARPGVYQPGGRPDQDIDPTAIAQRLRETFPLSLDRIEVRRGDARESVAAGSIEGVETAARWTEAGLTVELRVPLRQGPYAVGLGAVRSLALAIELGEVQRPGAARRRGGVPAGGIGGRPEGVRGDRNRDRPGPSRAEQGTVERWMTVDLAE